MRVVRGLGLPFMLGDARVVVRCVLTAPLEVRSATKPNQMTPSR